MEAVPLLPRRPMFTMRPESAYGKGRRTTALTIVKIAVFAAMPMASAATAVMVKLGLCRSTRIECLTSFRKDSIVRPPRFECNERRSEERRVGKEGGSGEAGGG